MLPSRQVVAFPSPARGSRPARVLAGTLVPAEAALAATCAYLLALLIAAARHPPGKEEATEGAPPEEPLKLVVLVPAHQEQGTIETAVDSLLRCAYRASSRRVIVIADNCEDSTAVRAAKAGAEVWERTDRDKRGKGFALAWALDRLLAEGNADGVVVVDADCTVSCNLLHEIDQRLREGADALQVNYVAGNPEASAASALRYAGFALMNTVRFLGKQHLGLSCGLVGTGMAFRRELLERERWREVGLVEDSEYHMRLVLTGRRTEFVRDAWVSSPMPTALGSSGEERWEQGRLELIRRWAPRLVLAGLAKRDVVRLHAGLECLVPPQSLIAASGLSTAALRFLLGPRRLAWLSAASLASQAVFVLGGLRLVRAPAAVYRALALAPALVAAKTGLYARLLRGEGPSTWVRSEREGGD